MKRKVNVKETLERIVEVDAETDVDAISEVERMFRDEEIVLDWTDYVDTIFTIVGE